VRGRFVFCGTFPGVAPAGSWPAPYSRGARTFLCPPDETGLQRPSGRLAWRDMRAGENLRQAPASAISGLCNRGRACYRRADPCWRVGGRIAQLVEQLTLNQRAVGSSPTAPTNEIEGLPSNLAVPHFVDDPCGPLADPEGAISPCTRDALTQSLSFALRFNGRKREHGADEIMAQITAERLIEHLERSGYVVMCKPGLDPHRVDLGAAIETAIKGRQEE
jgi:hypothetical protein